MEEKTRGPSRGPPSTDSVDKEGDLGAPAAFSHQSGGAHHALESIARGTRWGGFASSSVTRHSALAGQEEDVTWIPASRH